MILQRDDENERRTLGQLINDADDVECQTLELPYRGNQHNISRILAGVFKVELAFSQKHGYAMYWVRNVSGRGDIELHIGNSVVPPKIDSDGCILEGTARDGDNITGSRNAFVAFMRARGCDDYALDANGKVTTALVSDAAVLTFLQSHPGAHSFGLEIRDVPQLTTE